MEKGLKNHSQHIIRANSGKHLIFPNAIGLGNGRIQLMAGGIRIQPHLLCIARIQGTLHPWCRGIRIFIGVQLDHIRKIRLISRYIRYYLTNVLEITLHFSSLS